MAKVFGILMLVLLVWIGLEILTNGMDSAFGGIFATGDPSASSERSQSTMQSIRTRVQRDIRAGAARSTSGGDDDSLDEEPSDQVADGDEFGSEE